MTDRDLVEFICARLDEDARSALAWRGDRRSWQVVGHRNVQYHSGGSEGYVAVDVTGRVGDWWEQIRVMRDLGGLADHIARHDPARVLREVAVHRRVLERHRPVPQDDAEPPVGICLRCSLVSPCPDVRDLAEVWSDHPDFDPAWTVE